MLGVLENRCPSHESKIESKLPQPNAKLLLCEAVNGIWLGWEDERHNANF
jgi:hypothetical protein